MTATDQTGMGSGVGVAILITSIGGIMVYSALKGVSIADALSGKSGDTLDPHGSNGDITGGPAQQSSGTDSAGLGDPIAELQGGNWTAPPGGAHSFKGNHAGQLNTLAGIAQNTFHLTITATTNGTHVPGSYHYKGEAFDAAGKTADMDAFAKYVYENFPGVSELIHDGYPKQYAIKDGQRVDGSVTYATVWLGHRNHVHVAWG
jgi:hypothetical protein